MLKLLLIRLNPEASVGLGRANSNLLSDRYHLKGSAFALRFSSNQVTQLQPDYSSKRTVNNCWFVAN